MTSAPLPVILVVDDQEIMLQFCERILGQEYRFLRAVDGTAAQLVLDQRHDIAGVLLDRDFSHADCGRLLGPVADRRREGLHILRWLRHAKPHLAVVMVTGHRDQQAALEAAELGADYLVWDDVAADSQLLQARLRRALQADAGEAAEAVRAFQTCGVVGESLRLQRALVILHRVAFDANPILLLGETGTGKDTLAAAVHFLSLGHTQPFVQVNVGALAPSLIESELFGHERGAFTDARTSRPGLLRLAHGGTLFLNEIADLALAAQAKLLTVLERREVRPLGAERPVPTHFRLIAATAQDLRALVDRGSFRRDLYYRLAWNTVEIPPLRERRDDIPRLVQFALQQIAARGGRVTSLTREASEYLQTLSWPGNVRQLLAVVEAACAEADYTATLKDVVEVVCRHEGGRVGAAWREDPVAGVAEVVEAVLDRAALEEQLFADLDLESVKRRYIKCLLRLHDGNVTRVAEVSGVGRTTLFNWLRRWRQEENRGNDPT